MVAPPLRRSLVALEKIGTPEARSAVDRAMAKGAIYDYRPAPVIVDLHEVAANYPSLLAKIHGSERPNMTVMTLSLERFGTAKMAADYIATEEEPFVAAAAEWARRHGVKDQVKALLGTQKLQDFVDHPELSRPRLMP